MISTQPLRTFSLSLSRLSIRDGGRRSLTNSAAAIRRCRWLPAAGAAPWNTMHIAVPPRALRVTQKHLLPGSRLFSNSAVRLESNQPDSQPAIRTYDFETVCSNDSLYHFLDESKIVDIKKGILTKNAVFNVFATYNIL